LAWRALERLDRLIALKHPGQPLTMDERDAGGGIGNPVTSSVEPRRGYSVGFCACICAAILRFFLASSDPMWLSDASML
jgi:hypothetical protein